MLRLTKKIKIMKYIEVDRLKAALDYMQEKFPIPTYEAIRHLIDKLQRDLPDEDKEVTAENNALKWL